MAGILQVTGQEEEDRCSKAEDRQQDRQGGGQADQGTKIRWTTAGLLSIIFKTHNPNSEPTLYTRANSEPLQCPQEKLNFVAISLPKEAFMRSHGNVL